MERVIPKRSFAPGLVFPPKAGELLVRNGPSSGRTCTPSFPMDIDKPWTKEVRCGN